jgi:tetratricopeptide (TPR) repeat protein
MASKSTLPASITMKLETRNCRRSSSKQLKRVESRLDDPPAHLRGHQAINKRQYAKALDFFSTALKTAQGGEKTGLQVDLGLVQQRLGNIAASKAAYQKAVQETTQALSKLESAQSDRGHVGQPAGADELHSILGKAYAGLGDGSRAISEGQKAMEMRPTAADPFEGPLREEQMAQIYSLLGNADQAIPILKRWIDTPSATSITPALLRIDPIWEQSARIRVFRNW